MTSTAKAAATAAQRTREQAIGEAHVAYFHGIHAAWDAMPPLTEDISSSRIAESRLLLRACLAHLDEIERHLPDSPRRGMLNDYYGGDEE